MDGTMKTIMTSIVIISDHDDLMFRNECGFHVPGPYMDPKNSTRFFLSANNSPSRMYGLTLTQVAKDRKTTR